MHALQDNSLTAVSSGSVKNKAGTHAWILTAGQQ